MKRPRRSLHVSDSADGGGAEVVFRATVDAAESLGDVVDRYVGGDTRNPLSYVFSLRHYRGLSRKLRDFAPDVVHLHNFYHYLSPSVLWALRRYKRRSPTCRIVFTAHDYHLVCPNSGFQHVVAGGLQNYDPVRPKFSVFDRFDERSVAHSALKLLQHVLSYRVLQLRDVIDVIISPSQFLKGVFERSGLTTPIELIRNPVVVPTGDVDRPLGYGLVYLGRVAPEKGIAEFVRALDAAECEATLDVYGDGPDIGRLREISTELRSVSLELRGPVAHSFVPATLRRYRALVHASTWFENAPVSIIEAAAEGLGIVVCGGGGGEEMAGLVERHHVFGNGEPTSVARAVKAALSDEQLNRVMHPEDFSLSTYARRLDHVYGSL